MGRRDWNAELFDRDEREASPGPTDGGGGIGDETADIFLDVFQKAFDRINQDIGLLGSDEEAVSNMLEMRQAFGRAYGIIFGERPPTLPTPDQAG